DVYGYLMNAAGGNSPQMREIQRGASALVTFGYDAAGAQDQIDVDGAALDRPYDDAGRLARQSVGAGALPTTFRYDGRGYLAEAVGQVPDTSGDALFCDSFESATTGSWSGTGGGCTVPVVTTPTYSSEGVVYSLANGDGTRRHVIYLDDRPVAIVEESSGTSSVLWLTVDHLNTPVLATDVAGTAVWSGGFAPFGDDYADAQSAGVFLRFPGQWVDAAWDGGDGSTELAYNVHRWYQPGTGGYSRVDPLGLYGDPHAYAYSELNPIVQFDLLGLKCEKATSAASYICCDGQGGFAICVGRPGGDQIRRMCVRQHEEDHVQWFQENAPCHCAGKPKGACEFQLKRRQFNDLECRGYETEYRCLKKNRSRATGSEMSDIFARMRKLKREGKARFSCETKAWDKK
ncbi:MAG: RHS repeat-associated core domain-containing protein, partial [Acidobacteriota bacterium]